MIGRKGTQGISFRSGIRFCCMDVRKMRSGSGRLRMGLVTNEFNRLTGIFPPLSLSLSSAVSHSRFIFGCHAACFFLPSSRLVSFFTFDRRFALVASLPSFLTFRHVQVYTVGKDFLASSTSGGSGRYIYTYALRE